MPDGDDNICVPPPTEQQTSFSSSVMSSCERGDDGTEGRSGGGGGEEHEKEQLIHDSKGKYNVSAEGNANHQHNKFKQRQVFRPSGSATTTSRRRTADASSRGRGAGGPAVPVELELSSMSSWEQRQQDGERPESRQNLLAKEREKTVVRDDDYDYDDGSSTNGNDPPPSRGRSTSRPSALPGSIGRQQRRRGRPRSTPSPSPVRLGEMKIGGTLSYDSESAASADEASDASGNNGSGGWNRSSSGRRITFFPTVDEGNEDDDDESVDPLMEAMDFLEDEIDGVTYDELVPLPVRLALEENVFGWSHLFSDICGHIFYTAGGYALAFWTVTWLLLRKDAAAVLEDGSGCDGGSLACMFHRRSEPEYRPIFGMSFHGFVVLRGLCAIFSAISAFRTVRRRKRVWLRTDYGSAGYRSDARRRRKYVEESDRTTLLGRIRSGLGRKKDNYLARRVRKKLQRAGDRFERRYRRHRARLAMSQQGVDAVESHHHRVRVLAQSGRGVAKSSEKERATQRSDLVGSIPRGGHMDGAASVDSQTKDAAAALTDNDDMFADLVDVGKHDRRTRWRSHTRPSSVMQSVAHDQIPFSSGEIRSIPYAHGGFFGAAPFLLANPFWIDILRSLMPDVYVELSRRVVYTPMPKLIHWAENNPVVAAFGTAHEMEFSGRVSTLEWDVFLDPHLVKRVEIVLDERDKFLRRCVLRGGNRRVVDIGAHVSHYAEALVDDPAEKATLQYYNAEIRRRTVILVERMLIAHGNLTQLMLEQTGYAKKYNFGRVKRTRRTLGGGIFARQWLAVYAEALRMGMGGSEEEAMMDDEETELSTDSSFGLISPSSSSEEDEALTEDVPLLSSDQIELSPQVSRRSSMKEMQSSGCDSYEERERRDPSPNYESIPSPSRAPLRARRSARETPSSPRSDDESHSKDARTRLDAFSQGSVSDGPSPSVSPKKSPSRVRQSPNPRSSPPRRAQPGNHRSLGALAMSACPDTTIVESIALLRQITRCNAPLGLVLDIKSRHVSHRVWALIVDALRDAGARVEGVASFTVEEIRDMSSYCSSPVNEIFFFHSAGDIQQACHQGLVKRGDKVFFNAGSLLWHKRDWTWEVIREATYEFMYFDADEWKRSYRLQPHASIVRPFKKDRSSPGKDASEYDSSDDDRSTSSATEFFIHRDESACPDERCSTIQDYKDHFRLSIGLYVQEFAIDDAAMDFLVKHVNENSHVYDLGLSWGGVNGVTVRGIQPDRWTNTDGFWNQRYGGASWDPALYPNTIGGAMR